MIGTVFRSQADLLSAIRELFLDGEYFQVDATYGPGAMHRELRPERCFDIAPKFDFVEKADCTALPFFRGSEVKSILFDPPFLAGGTEGSKMHAHYSSFKSIRDLFSFYAAALAEFHRVLKPGGILVFKCQDVLNGRTQGFSHCEIYRHALFRGFYALDLFVLHTPNRMKPHNMVAQHHARKTHSYFWVFKKCDRRNYRGA